MSWPQALGRAARELRALVSSGCPVGVLASGRTTNEESYLSVKLARGALTSPHVDAFLREPYEALLRGLGAPDSESHPGAHLKEVEESHRILVLEGDLSVSHPRVALAVLRAVRNGAALVTWGLARTQLSQLARAHFHLDPSSPWKLPTGLLDALRSPGAPVAEGAMVILAPYSSDPQALTATTRALAEALRKRGDGDGGGTRFFPLPIRANTRGSFEMGAVPNALPGVLPLTDPGAQSRIRGAWGVDFCVEEGLDAAAMLEEVEGLVIVREHPPACAAYPYEARKALQRMRSLVVLDSYRSFTSDNATVSLPVAALAESDGTFTSMEGRLGRLRAGPRPPVEARPAWAVLSALVEALGVRSAYPSVSEVGEEIARVIPGYGDPGGLMMGEPVGAVDRDGWAPGGNGGTHASHRLVLEGAFEWDDDLPVTLSPTLQREGAARRKLFPGGRVTMHPEDGKALGIRAGWPVRLRSRHGEVLVPVDLSTRAERGLLLAPFGFRESLHPVLVREWAECVEVERP